MDKEEIGLILKQLRINNGKTQKEVAEILGRKQQVVGHWETGYSQPDANTLFKLCGIYGVSVDEAFGFSKNKVLSQRELSLIDKYETLDLYGKKVVDCVVDIELERVLSSEKAVKFAARGGHIEMTEEQAINLAKSANEAPNDAHNKDIF